MSLSEAEIPPQPSDNQTAIWLALTVFIGVVLLAMAFGGIVIWFIADETSLGPAVQHETDWPDDVQRRSFVQRFSPITIPTSAANFTVQYRRFHTTALDVRFTLAPEDYAAMEAAVRSASGQVGVFESYQLPSNQSPGDYISYHFNGELHAVELNYQQSP